MQKALIIILFVCNAGCTASRYYKESTKEVKGNSIDAIVLNVKNNNISDEDFFIEKGEISITRRGEVTKFFFTVKFEKPDKFLFSLKSGAGIEGARIYIEKDTLLINERLNKKVLYGNTDDLEKVFGFPYIILRMAFGDLLVIGDTSKTKAEIINNKWIIKQEFHGEILVSEIDTKFNKVKSTVFLNSNQKETITLKYSEYLNSVKHIPGVIDINNKENQVFATIKIFRVISPWDGKIEFIPGNGYIKEKIK